MSDFTWVSIHYDPAFLHWPQDTALGILIVFGLFLVVAGVMCLSPDKTLDDDVIEQKPQKMRGPPRGVWSDKRGHVR